MGDILEELDEFLENIDNIEEKNRRQRVRKR